MSRTPIASRTLITSSLAVTLTLIGVLFLFTWIHNKNKDRAIAERAQLEIDSIEVFINDSYTLGDLIGLRKYLDTFAKMNSWESGSLVDSLGSEIWRLEPKTMSGSSRRGFQANIQTVTGGTIGKLEIVKNQNSENGKWDEQYLLSLLVLIGIAVIVLSIQSYTLLKILKPVSELASEIRKEAKKLNLQLTDEKDEDDIFLIKKWFSEVVISWNIEKERVASESKFRAIGSLAAQVAHDIRSPLAAFDNILGKFNNLPEAERILIRTAVNRIKDIANNLIEKNREIKVSEQTLISSDQKNGSESISSQLLFSLVDPLISEKRMQFRAKSGVEIDTIVDSSSYGLFGRVSPSDFQRILSNLINNGVEAIDNDGRVTVFITHGNSKIHIIVQDNGRGIPAEIVPKIGQRGKTYGKDGGSGLGLFHARTTVESWGGNLDVSSQLAPHPEQGTTVTLTIPMAERPDFFVTALKLTRGSTVVVLDDDPSIHGIWRSRFGIYEKEKNGIKVHHFSTPDEIIQFAKKSANNGDMTTYLTDYELLGHNQNGLDLIEQLGIGQQSILVTSRFEEKSIVERAERLGVKLIPKSMAGLVPIFYDKTKVPLDVNFSIDDEQFVQSNIASANSALSGSTKLRYDLCLIDDDRQLIHTIWNSIAKEKRLNIIMFATSQEFLSAADKIDRSTPIYVDVSLGEGILGTDFAHEIHKLGFIEINLATGYDADSIEIPHFICRVVGKDFPELKRLL